MAEREIIRCDNAIDVAGLAARAFIERVVELQSAGDDVHVSLTGGTVGILTLKTLAREPDLERIEPTTFVGSPISCDVIEPRANQTSGHRPKRDVVHVVRITTACTPTLAPKFDCGQNAKGDHQPVHMEWPELVRRRTRD